MNHAKGISGTLILVFVLLNTFSNLPLVHAQKVEIVQEKYYQSTDWWYEVLGVDVFYVIELSDGSAVFSGTTSEDYVYDRKLVLFKINQYGDVLWSNIYQPPEDNLTIFPVGLLWDNKSNEIILGGITASPNSEQRTPIILRISPTDGRLIQVTKYTPEMPCELTSVSIDSDGNIYLAGEQHMDNSNLCLIKTDPEGIVKWSRVYDSGEADTSPKLSSIRNGKLVMVATTEGFRDSTEFQFTSIWELMIDSETGYTLWMNTYVTFKDEVTTGVTWVSPSLVAIWGILPQEGQSIVLLASASVDGHIIWSKSYPMDPVSYLAGSIENYNDKIIIGYSNLLGLTISGDPLFSKALSAWDFAVRDQIAYVATGASWIAKFNLSKINEYSGAWIWNDTPVNLQELPMVVRRSSVSSQYQAFFKQYRSEDIQVEEKNVKLHVEPFDVYLAKNGHTQIMGV